MKVIVCGYNWVGCCVVQKLIEAGHDVFVYTHEDNPYFIPDLREFCLDKNIPFSTENISKSELPFKPDIICSIYYRFIIKEHVISLVEGRIFNLHPSLLPKYKGCSSITWALINNEDFVGFTYHYIDNGLDTGNIILQRSLKVYSFDTQATLYSRVMIKALDFFFDAFELVKGNYKGEIQIGDGHSYSRGCPHNGIIDSKWDDAFVKRFIRAMTHPPYPPATFLGKEILTYQDFLDLKSLKSII